jgi:hypothetical protein
MKRLALAVAFAALTGCNDNKEWIGFGEAKDWQGWVYPNRGDLTDDIPIGSYNSLAKCGEAARNILDRLDTRDEEGQPIEGDYECGYRCKPDGYGLNVCEKTER